VSPAPESDEIIFSVRANAILIYIALKVPDNENISRNVRTRSAALFFVGFTSRLEL
jgi:hypothetical protein